MTLPASTLLRLVAAWLVLLSHACALRGFPLADPVLVATRGAFGASHLGLAIFFVLSGNLVAGSAARSRDALDFAIRRFRRIAPGWIACWVVVCLVAGPLLTSATMREYWLSGELPRAMARMLAGSARWDLPGVFLDHPLRSANGSLWTIPYEIAFYAVLALAVFGLGRRRRVLRWVVPALWVASIAILAFPGALPEDDSVRLAGFRVVYLARFGALFAGGWTLSVIDASRRSLARASGFALALWIASWWSPSLSPAADALFLPILVVWLGGVPVGWMERMWDISYGYYLWGWPVQQILLQLRPGISTGELLAASTVATLLPAMASWTLVERRFLRRSPFGS